MDVGTVERGIIIRVNGDGSLAYHHAGLTPLEIIGTLELVKQYAFHDLVSAEQKAADDAALIAALRKTNGS